MTPARVDVAWPGGQASIAHAWVGRHRSERHAPLVVFLHEGLGACSTWGDHPARQCEAWGARGLVYDRPGYGRSTAAHPHRAWTPRFLHDEALQVLPALLSALGVDEPVWLFGHSDGGSIALLHAAHRPAAIAGVVAVAPHIVVEPITLASIRAARQRYAAGELKARLAPHHDDPDALFEAWSGAWLDPAFAAWCIADEIAAIGCPLLAVQGDADPYGTLEQVHGIARRVPQARVVVLPGCGHSPHREQPEALLQACGAFLERWG